MKVRVVGNSLAALVLCERLVNESIHVEHLTLGDGNLGGYFSGVNYQDHRIDLGMVLLEPRCSPESEDISNYSSDDPSRINSFNSAVFGWLSTRCETLNEIEVLTRFKANLYGDIVISDDLSFLGGFDGSERLSIVLQLKKCIAAQKHHPSKKLTDNYFSENSIHDVYCDLYGTILANYLCGHIRLLAGDKGLNVVSRMHRSIWMPLIYPEDFLYFFEHRNSNLSKLPFFGFGSGSFAGMIENLCLELQDSSYYERTAVTRDAYLEALRTNEESVRKDTFCFANDKELIDVKAEISTEQIGFVIGKTNYEKNLVVNNLDFESSWYKFTATNAGSEVCIVEVGKIEEDITDIELFARANEACSDLGFNEIKEPIPLRSRIQLFDAISYKDIEMRREQVKEMYSNMDNLFCLNELSSSINHQVALGLKAFSTAIGGHDRG
jgi:hypothetical protein